MNEQLKEQPKKKLKPVTFVKGRYSYHRQDKFKQNLLLKALQITSDPKKLKQMIGAKTVADVFRTLDKLAIRKEYHEALGKHGLNLETIVGGIKEVCEGASSESVKLKGYQTLLRSLGLDRYEEQLEKGGAGWEDIVLKMAEAEQSKPKLEESKPIDADYEVIEPVAPEEEQKRIDEEEAVGRSLYE